MSGGNSVYSPLPQSNSDTDESSEEELHSSNESRIINKISRAQIPKPESILNGQKQKKSTNYKPLNENSSAGIMLNGFQSNADQVSILTPSANLDKLSAARKICFLFSMFVCIFTIVVFIWVLPCDTGTCPSAPVSSAISTWEQTLNNIELYGPVNVVPEVFGKRKNLVILFKNGSEPEDGKTLQSKGGIISLMGHNGQVAWYVKLERRPTDIDCNLIDVDLDGFNDCLVIGDDDMLKAVQSIAGTEMWDVHGPDFKKNLSMYHFEFPLVLPDLDGDGVKELLTACSFRQNSTSKRQNHLVIISGKSGAAVGVPVEIKTCSALHNLLLEKDFNITYTCIDFFGKESVRTTNLSDICEMMKCPFDPFLGKDNAKNNQLFHLHKMDSVVGNVFQIGDRRLLLENKGSCPDCNVSVFVKDEREKINRTVYTFESANAYGMTPVTISFGKIKGFIVKFWQWHLNKEEKNFYEKNSPFRSASTVDSGKMKADFEVVRKRLKTSYKDLDQEMMSGASSSSKRFKRSESYETGADKRVVHRISERVVLITFNKTDSRFVNASHFEIIQLCQDSKICQPDVRSQSKSLLLTDLDQDGFQELISYTTTYKNRNDDDGGGGEVRPETWKLQSKIRVVRLESELPKLYDGLTRP